MDPNDTALPPPCNPFNFPDAVAQIVPGRWEPSHSMSHHSNGPHQTRVTNLHTHGLHVAPNRNADGSHSVDVMLRVLPRADWEERIKAANGEQPARSPDEEIGEVDVSIRLGNVWQSRQRRDGAAPQPHAPGTGQEHVPARSTVAGSGRDG